MSHFSSPQRHVYLPSQDFSEHSLPLIELEATSWVRIHLDVHQPLFFSKNKNHRFSPEDGKHEVFYAASDFQTAFMEVFGDTILGQQVGRGCFLSAKRWRHSVCSTVSSKELRLCDFSTIESRNKLQIDLAALFHPDLRVAHEWSSAVMLHPDNVDGILYPSRFTGKNCLALFRGKENVSVTDSVPFQNHEKALEQLDAMTIALV